MTALLLVTVVFGAFLLLQWDALRSAPAPTRWAAYLLLGVSGLIYLVNASNPSTVHPGFELFRLLEAIDPFGSR